MGGLTNLGLGAMSSGHRFVIVAGTCGAMNRGHLRTSVGRDSSGPPARGVRNGAPACYNHRGENIGRRKGRSYGGVRLAQRLWPAGQNNQSESPKFLSTVIARAVAQSSLFPMLFARDNPRPYGK